MKKITIAKNVQHLFQNQNYIKKINN